MQRAGAQWPTAQVLSGLEVVARGVHRRSDGVWCADGSAEPISPAAQYAMVDVVGNGMVDVHEDRAVMQARGWLALAVARPDLVG